MKEVLKNGCAEVTPYCQAIGCEEKKWNELFKLPTPKNINVNVCQMNRSQKFGNFFEPMLNSFTPSILSSAFLKRNFCCSQCDQIGGLGNLLATNFITKVAQIISNFLDHLENHCFLSQTVVATFRATFEQTWATFYFNIWSHSRLGDDKWSML